jgi:ubiquinone/menaquinone biosynthesis C-methylase UbiE
MGNRVCPWWLGYFLASPLRRWIEIKDPEGFLRPYLKPGMTVFEPGPGMGFFTLPMAKLVAPSGCIIVADIQPQMLNALRGRAEKAGLSSRIETRLVGSESLAAADLEGKVDFALAWAVVHEFPSADNFFGELAATLKPGGSVLFGEPAGHVNADHFSRELDSARLAGLAETGRLQVRRSTVALLRKNA